MIEKETLQQYAAKQQTRLSNVLREYYQHRYLTIFYQQKGSEAYFFKGGTALRVVFRSPRYSEDLDFTAIKNSHRFENILEDVLIQMQKEGVPNEFVESKPTSGGHVAIIQSALYGMGFSLKIEVSFRKLTAASEERMVVTPDYLPGYVVQVLATPQLVSEKVQAFLTRTKPRDVFDLYFLLRSPRANRYVIPHAGDIRRVLDTKDVGLQGLKDFLPQSFWPVIKDLKKHIASELAR